jgi:anti-sigma B factor antagonist
VGVRVHVLGARVDGYTKTMRTAKLGIEEHADGERHTLLLTGELDIAGAAPLEQTVARLCRAGAKEIVLDLRELAFLDSIGFRAILATKMLCEEYGCEFFMTRAREPVQHLFDVTGMLRKLPFR